MIDTNIKYLDFDPCNFIINKDICMTLCNQGQLLNIRVYLDDICQCHPIILGVLICYKNSPYALQTKKIYADDCCCCCNFTLEEDFEFIFPFETCKDDITTRAIVHYICD